MANLRQALKEYPAVFRPLLIVSILTFLASVLTRFVEYYGKSPKQAFFPYIGKLFMGTILENIISVYNLVATNLIIIILVLIAILYVVKTKFPVLYEATQKFAKGAQTVGSFLWDKASYVKDGIDGIKMVIEEIKEGIEEVKDGIDDAIKAFEEIGKAIVETTEKAVEEVKSGTEAALGAAAKVFGR